MFCIVGYDPNKPRSHKTDWLHSTGYFCKDKAQARIDSGDVRKYLMDDLKNHAFVVVAYRND